jgi:hypothetical protein
MIFAAKVTNSISFVIGKQEDLDKSFEDIKDLWEIQKQIGFTLNKSFLGFVVGKNLRG